MKIAIALRTCDGILNHWNVKRCVDANKSTLLLTCLNSLLSAIINTKHEVIFSIHDDTSSEKTLTEVNFLCKKYGVNYELIHSGKLGNFKSQYEWIKRRTYDFVYCVEDDFLHRETIFNDLIDMYQYLQEFVNHPGTDYGFFPWNPPHRYDFFPRMYPVMLFKYKNKYWRSDLQSTHTFFVTKNTFDSNDKYMRQQSYLWPAKEGLEPDTICKVWQEQVTRLVVPLESLAYHLSDSEMPEIDELWKKYYYETR